MSILPYHKCRDNICTEPLYAEGIVNCIIEFPKKIEGFHANSVLDIGTGKGHVVAALVAAGFDAYGVDIRDICEGDRRRFVIADARALPFRNESFDLVYQCAFLADINDLQKLPKYEIELVVNEMHRVLRPDGFVFNRISFPLGMPDKFVPLEYCPDKIGSIYQKI